MSGIRVLRRVDQEELQLPYISLNITVPTIQGSDITAASVSLRLHQVVQLYTTFWNGLLQLISFERDPFSYYMGKRNSH
jgi:hypothetical protein